MRRQHSYFTNNQLTTLALKNENKNKTNSELHAKLKELKISLGKAKRLTNNAELEAIKEKNTCLKLKESFEASFSKGKAGMRVELEEEFQGPFSNEAIASFKPLAEF